MRVPRSVLRATMVVALIVIAAIATRRLDHPIGGGFGASIVRAIVMLRTRAYAAASAFHDPSGTEGLRREVGELRASTASLAQELTLERARHTDAQPGHREAYRTIRGDILAAMYGPTAYTLTVRAGAADGVRVGQPVLVSGALIGIVERVGNQRAIIALLADAGTRIATERARAPGVIGVVEPSAGGGLTLRNMPNDAAIDDHADIVTSAENIGIPRGLPIGRVTGIHDDTDGFFRSGIVEAHADPRSAYVVDIVLADTATP